MQNINLLHTSESLPAITVTTYFSGPFTQHPSMSTLLDMNIYDHIQLETQ